MTPWVDSLDFSPVVAQRFHQSEKKEARVCFGGSSWIPVMTQDELKERLRRPTETLQLELKAWLGLETPIDKARIARALIALRNRNGGLLVIGFDDRTVEPIEQERPDDLRAAYHPDALQKLVNEFVTPSFPITVEYVEREGREFPVIVVASGVKSPSMGRQDVKNEKGDRVLRQYGVYTRTAVNDVVQTTEPRSTQDWEELLGVCFDNREADVGRFLRRNLGPMLDELGLTPILERKPVSDQGSTRGVEPARLTEKALPPNRTPEAVIDESAHRFEARAEYLSKQTPPVSLPKYAAWREVEMMLTGPIRPLVGQHLLGAVFPRHPRLTSWPLWIDSRSSDHEWTRPYPADNGWEAIMTRSDPDIVKGPIVDFWRIDPRGEFYHRRTLEDDLWTKVDDAERGKLFDIINAIKRVAEALVTVQSFALGLSENPEGAKLRVAFRWTNLSGRKLFSTDRGRDFFAPTAAYEDTARSSLEVPVSTTPGAIASYVNQAVTPLFLTFGYEVPRFVVDEVTAKTLKNNRTVG